MTRDGTEHLPPGGHDVERRKRQSDPAQRRLLESLSLGVMHAVDECIVYANPAIAAMLGTTPDKIIGTRILDAVHPDDRSMVRTRYERRQSGGQSPLSYEIRMIRADGATVRVEIEPRALNHHESLALFRDVGTRVGDSALVIALYELAQRVQEARTVARALETACSGLLQLGMRATSLEVLDQQVIVREFFAPPATRHWLEETASFPVVGRSFPLDVFGFAPRLFEESRAVYVDDFLPIIAQVVARVASAVDVQRYIDAIRDDGFRRAVLAPLGVGSRPWGALVVTSDALTRGDAASIGLFASQISSALALIETIEDLAERNSELAAIHAVAEAGSETDLARLYPRLLEIAAKATDSDVATFFLLDDARKELVYSGSYGYSGPLGTKYARVPLQNTATGEALATLRPRSLNARDWPEASRADMLDARLIENAIIPLQIKGKLAGTLNLARHAERAYDADTLRSAELLAGQIAIQVENARLLSDLRKSYAELERTQETLVKRERLAALGELAAVVAHEVRNPIGVIFNSLSPLRRTLDPKGDAATLLRIVGEEAKRLNRMVGELLNFARPHALVLRTGSIAGVVEAAIESAVAESDGPTPPIETDLADDLPLVKLDPQMVHQALVNVLSNALQASRPSDTLRVVAVGEEHEGRRFARIDVTDRGEGIPDEIAPRIFEPFFTTRATGAGLGLAIVKRIVEAHKGEVRFVSRKGVGTTFTILLPIDEPRTRF